MWSGGYFEVVLCVFHLGLPEIFLHVVAVVRLIEPGLLQAVQHLDFGQSIRNWWNCFLESHAPINNKCCMSNNEVKEDTEDAMINTPDGFDARTKYIM